MLRLYYLIILLQNTEYRIAYDRAQTLRILFWRIQSLL